MTFNVKKGQRRTNTDTCGHAFASAPSTTLSFLRSPNPLRNSRPPNNRPGRPDRDRVTASSDEGVEETGEEDVERTGEGDQTPAGSRASRRSDSSDSRPAGRGADGASVCDVVRPTDPPSDPVHRPWPLLNGGR